jgi:hypothetical protein
VGLVEGALRVIFGSTSPDSILQEVRRLGEMGLEEGRHFTVKMPEGGGRGYVRVLREGLAYVAWLSVYGSGRQQELATDFVTLPGALLTPALTRLAAGRQTPRGSLPW